MVLPSPHAPHAPQPPTVAPVQRLALLGCGLMGGSFALALKRAGLVQHVAGYSRSPATTALAQARGVIDSAASSAAEAAEGADVVLLAVPVAATEATLRGIRAQITDHTLVMDVGSTKRDVVDAARRVLREQLGHFVPAHPIAGKELAGVEHADAELYQGKLLVLTPLERTLPEALTRAHGLWSALGSQVRVLSPEAHDAAFAAVSHLPHLLAFAFINGLSGQPQGADFMAMAGPGFRDFTRIAASDPSIWRDILLANREEVLAQSQAFQRALQALELTLTSANGEALQNLIEQASHTRAHWRMASTKPHK